jgi:anti-anti-sigma regulatory factor
MPHVTTELEIWLHGDEQHSVVRLRGCLDATSAPFARRVVHDLLADPTGAARIDLHLEETSVCDHAAARMLLTLDAEATRSHRQIIMYGLATGADA